MILCFLSHRACRSEIENQAFRGLRQAQTDNKNT